MVTLSGIRHLFQSLSTVTLSATSQAMLQSASQTCRHVQRPPWYVTIATLKVAAEFKLWFDF